MKGNKPRFFTLLWNNEYCQFLYRMGVEGQRLRFVWGGHNQLSRFSHYKVSVGDYICPVRVFQQTLFVIARMRVKQVTTRDEYLVHHPLDELLILHECANEILVGENGSIIRSDVTVPGHLLEQLRFMSKRGERHLKYVQDGRLLRSISLEGVYCLAPASAKALVSLLGEQY